MLDIVVLPRLLALRHLRNLRERGLIRLPSEVGQAPALDAAYPSVEHVSHEDVGGVASASPTLDAVPVLLLSPGAVEAMQLDPRARILVEHVNDERTVEQILATTRMDPVDGTILFEQLADEGIVAFV